MKPYRLLGCLGCSLLLSVGLLAKEPPGVKQKPALFEDQEVTKAKIKLAQLAQIPLAKRSFENFFRPWYAIKSAFYLKVCGLKRAFRPSYEQWLTDLQQQIDPDKTFSSALKAYSEQASKEEVDPYQRYLLQQEDKSIEELCSSDRYVAIDGDAEEVTASQPSFHCQIYDIRDTESQPTDEDFSVADSDLLVFQGVERTEQCYALYNHLKSRYANFYVKQASGEFSRFATLIACKYAVEEAQWIQFDAQEGRETDGFFDCLVRSGDLSLAHMYVVNLRTSLPPDLREQHMKQIVEKIHTDLSKEFIPPILCGYLGYAGDPFDPAQKLAADYFHVWQNQRVGIYIPKAFRCNVDGKEFHINEPFAKL